MAKEMTRDSKVIVKQCIVGFLSLVDTVRTKIIVTLKMKKGNRSYIGVIGAILG